MAALPSVLHHEVTQRVKDILLQGGELQAARTAVGLKDLRIGVAADHKPGKAEGLALASVVGEVIRAGGCVLAPQSNELLVCAEFLDELLEGGSQQRQRSPLRKPIPQPPPAPARQAGNFAANVIRQSTHRKRVSWLIFRIRTNHPYLRIPIRPPTPTPDDFPSDCDWGKWIERRPPDYSGSSFWSDQVLLSTNFRSRPGCRQKSLVSNSGVVGGGENLVLIRTEFQKG